MKLRIKVQLLGWCLTAAGFPLWFPDPIAGEGRWAVLSWAVGGATVVAAGFLGDRR